jgi:hypothetical protein
VVSVGLWLHFEFKKVGKVGRCWPLRTRFSMLKLANKCAIYGKENVTALNAQVARDFANEEYLGVAPDFARDTCNFPRLQRGAVHFLREIAVERNISLLVGQVPEPTHSLGTYYHYCCKTHNVH